MKTKVGSSFPEAERETASHRQQKALTIANIDVSHRLTIDFTTN